MKLCSLLCGSLDGRGVWVRMDIHICMALLFTYNYHSIVINYTPIQNKKLKK